MLSALIHRAEDDKVINGLKINAWCLSITHLFFVDDSLLFFKANRDEALLIKRILQQYKAASGQTVNFHKLVLTVNLVMGMDQTT